ncbi:PREDICTED: probable sphingolipid transporter spinster homolog 2 [Fragaria vesca subsp. vesca]|uniref:probable sphingolipid transporter spinster homolog 2 n=1 Tax=Fragaria vesca subsp. vesca TaxID=101020 RepID=UPI0002C2F703|nr:PREDICTED: probable sphingolipid transporter spinster homolog 2 [Fragaria vesca subsp. vesca]
MIMAEPPQSPSKYSQVPIPKSLPPITKPPKAAISAPKPSWFSPERLLLILCLVNLINYIDRGAIASNGVNGSIGICDESGICHAGTGIQGDFKLNNFQDGVLSSAFMVGLLLASPIFASLAKSHNPFRLIGVGLSIWTFATAGCGSSFNFWSIAICRMLVGVGEASFISLAAPFIDDHAPADQKTAWLATFYMCIPTGVAIGYVYGGCVGDIISWRCAFWGEALLMLPFAVLNFLVKPLQMKGLPPTGSTMLLESIETSPLIEGLKIPNINGRVTVASGEASWTCPIIKFLNELSSFSKDLKVLLVDKVYIVNVLGYVSYNFVIGTYSYWGPKAGYNIYHMSKPDLMFGGITLLCGLVGTLSGGLILDAVGATIQNAFKLLAGATMLGAIFCFSAFCAKNLYNFVVLFSLGELLLFSTQAPVNYVSLHCVKPGLRPLSMAISTLSIHVFGDVPSSPLVGVVQDYVENWRKTTLIFTSVYFVATGIWFIGIFLRSVDKFEEDDEDDGVSPIGQTNKEPLLEDHTIKGGLDSGEL